ncbi:LysM peptidoglycan-binding domain-containing protein [Actinoalloteichus hymeniacidonis]|uniref:LysM domain-containing protein n=1 Tax=Actinoalloteichus hymeniacidonis TaxID=340345 RepID=A0AAC9HNB8_9PSEU|nr:LysM peptidoglycan-binding domain-containing protein [Actinoalloteichus hymeniacidonis]AOS62532.1 LysM domain-containing protein [Actinoalloteichus hymeniacidonis]MBB5909437.1 hypothetical protein [Actinoalloteichus hymeniacidonis]
MTIPSNAVRHPLHPSALPRQERGREQVRPRRVRRPTERLLAKGTAVRDEPSCAVGIARAGRRGVDRVGRRSSMAAVVCAVVSVLLVLGILGRVTQPIPVNSVPAATTTTLVGAGETLWSIARRTVPESPQGEVVARIKLLNGPDAADLRVGRVLRVPAGTGVGNH